MTNEKINEMWTKLNETKLDGTRAATILKKFMTKEEHAAYTKESLEYIQNHPECMDTTKKFDKAVNAIVLKHVESHKFADAKKLMAKIATFVERMVADNEIEMPEIVFDATSCKANKKQIKLAVIELLYKVNKDEEAIYKSICNWLVEVFGKFYGKTITADVDAIWNEVEENDDDDDDDNDDNDEGMCFEDLDDEEEIPTNEIAGIKGAKMLVHSYDEKWGTFRRIFQFDNMHYYNEDGEIVEYGSGMYTVSKSKSGLYASLKIGNKPFAISPEDAKSLFGWAQLHVNDLAIKKMAKEVNKPVEEVRKIWQDNLLDGWNFDNRLEYEEFRDFYVL